MNTSRAWLQREYFDAELPATEVLADTLTFHVAEVDDVKGDLMDVQVLPDRSAYMLSHRGIAKELSAALTIPMKRDPLREPIPEYPATDALSISIETPKSARQMGALVRGVTVGPSPAWLKEALESVGQRSINNIVDVTNYVMLNIGQPLHAFDTKKITWDGDRLPIRIREAREGESITVLSGEEYVLPEGTIVIAEGVTDRALDIAGIKGGIASAITEHTTELYISVANFDGVSVRKTAQALKLWTDASSRFQNKLPPALVAYGMRDALALITEIAGGEVVGIVDVYPEPTETQSVSVTVAHVNSLLGSSFSRGDIEQALARLDFSYTLVEDRITVLPSFERRDICIAEDLIEEIGRTIGYEHIVSAALPLMKTAPDQARFRGIEAIRDFLVERGFTEVSTPSFTKDGDIELANPLQSERPYLRASLLPALEDALGRAVLAAPRVLGPSRFVKLFEIGNVFTKHGEMLVVSMGVHDTSGTSAPEALKENVATLEQELLRIPASARYSLDGSMMELNLDQVNLEKLGDTYAPQAIQLASYRPYSVYPCALRDVAVWTPEGTEESEVMNTILKEAGEFLVRVDLFDRFEKEGRISYAFRLVFESLDRTLSDTDLDPAIARVATSLNEKEGWQVR